MQSPRKVHGGSVPKQTTETAQAQMVEEEEDQERERESGTAANSENEELGMRRGQTHTLAATSPGK